jgi:hypothetical protein
VKARAPDEERPDRGTSGLPAPTPPTSTRRTLEVHVGRLKLTYNTSPAKARQILEDANFRPTDEYVLEGLRGANGPVDREHQADDDGDLTNEHAQPQWP